MRGVLSLTHIPVAARAAHRVINVIMFIFLPFFLVLPLLIFYLFSCRQQPRLKLIPMCLCYPFLIWVVILFQSPLCSEDDAKVQRKTGRSIISDPLSHKNGLVFDLHQIIVFVHKILSTMFVSSTNSAIVSCSGRFVMYGLE